MNDSVGRYVEPPEGDFGIFRSAIDAGEWGSAGRELVGLAMHSDDWRMVQELCLALLDHDDVDLRSVAIICLSHIARIHRRLGPGAISELEARASDPSVGALVHEILEEIEIYLRSGGDRG
ncbi:hypothetical protein [Tenggerimyces flavus]|uniref:HEAT repeat domain-containing protein n=1 Tax=Tenggerimyces flavus TaxID=1708749 RepID=A0ABV7Y4V9_9ACTN|nr:hypothetical protein [Tenggerimyces flavus]MBM7790864.1 hypothetical protein [Tenggerimyces flavus]